MELHNDISFNSSSPHKIPKKIDYWYFEKYERQLEQQINYLKAEIKQKDEVIYSLTIGSKEIEKNVESPKKYEPVGKHNPVKIIAQMEAIDRKNYWEKEIARRDAVIASEGNTTNIDEEREILNETKQ